MPKPMRLIVTGATGFIGSHVIEAALEHGHEVVAVGRNRVSAKNANWFSRVEFKETEIYSPNIDVGSFGEADILLHLAWPDLNNFKNDSHVDEHLPANIRFLEKMSNSGQSRILATGTCLEYGHLNGELRECIPTRPTVPYAQAKDSLRRHFMEGPSLAGEFSWARLFYMYGRGQNPKSILAQLDTAIDGNETTFPMSKGEQLRDYLPVEVIAKRLLQLAEATNSSGIYNICSGEPISIRNLVENRIAERSANITPQLGYYPYPDYEAMAFWGSGTKFQREVDIADE